MTIREEFALAFALKTHSDVRDDFNSILTYMNASELEERLTGAAIDAVMMADRLILELAKEKA